MDLSNLNDPQQQAVAHGHAPLLVLAGAGSGKTTVITYRIASFVQHHGVSPHEILAVTFTNKAAREMQTRTAQLIGVAPRSLDIGTFHGICGRILRQHGATIGIEPNFVIYNQDDQLRLMKRCLKELNVDTQKTSPKVILGRIDKWKNKGLGPSHVQPTKVDPTGRTALQAYELYAKRCLEANAVDFGDMLLHTVQLFKKDSSIREHYQQRWTHLLVDEYQDTNPVQYQLLSALMTPNHSLTVVGDDDQSIYRWRGADIGNILRFERDFPGATVIRLEQNYRSTKTVLDAANAVIANNSSRKGKTLFTQGEQGQPLSLRVFASERDEGQAIAESIDTLIKQDFDPGDMAILYRTNAQSRAIEDALRRRRIAYRVYGGLRFYDRKEIRDALAYMRLLVNPKSDVDFLRVINTPARGIGKTSIDRLIAWANSTNQCLMHTAASTDTGVNLRIQKKVAVFVQLIETFSKRAHSEHPGRLVESLLNATGYLDALRQDGSEEAASRIDNLAELIAAIDEYAELSETPGLLGFLEEVALASDIDALAQQADHVSLMTLHSAKGLEFQSVFMPGMEDGLFPLGRQADDRAGLEEERRLCYVGITRAKEMLYLSAARTRMVFGELRYSDLSRFIGEIPEALMHFGDHAFDEPTTHAPSQTSYDGEIGTGYTVGMRVRHKTFGQGAVLSINGIGKQQKLTIDFPTVGTKTIVARFVESP